MSLLQYKLIESPEPYISKLWILKMLNEIKKRTMRTTKLFKSVQEASVQLMWPTPPMLSPPYPAAAAAATADVFFRLHLLPTANTRLRFIVAAFYVARFITWRLMRRCSVVISVYCFYHRFCLLLWAFLKTQDRFKPKIFELWVNTCLQLRVHDMAFLC